MYIQAHIHKHRHMHTLEHYPTLNLSFLRYNTTVLPKLTAHSSSIGPSAFLPKVGLYSTFEKGNVKVWGSVDEPGRYYTK